MQYTGFGNVCTEGAMMIFWSRKYQCLKSCDIYVWSKVVCFVLFCFTLRRPKPQCFMPLLVSLERLFDEWGAPTWFQSVQNYSVKLSIIEPFSQWKLYKNKTEFQGVLDFLGKPSASWIIISQFSELRCEGYWFLSGFCRWRSKQIAKF